MLCSINLYDKKAHKAFSKLIYLTFLYSIDRTQPNNAPTSHQSIKSNYERLFLPYIVLFLMLIFFCNNVSHLFFCLLVNPLSCRNINGCVGGSMGGALLPDWVWLD